MKQLHTKRALLLFFGLFLIGQTWGQTIEQRLKSDQRVKDYRLNPELKTPASIFFRPQAAPPAAEAKNILQNFYATGNQSEFRTAGATEVKGGIRVEKFKQYFKGIKVEHAAYNVISRNGNIFSILSESYALTDAFTTAPQLSFEEAKAKSLQFVNAQKYAWEALEEDKRLYPGNTYMQTQLEALKQTYLPKNELVIARDQYGSKTARLAYKLDVYAVQPLGRFIIYVDAITGKILLRDVVIKHADKADNKAKPESLNYIPNFQYYQLAAKGQIKYNAPKPLASVQGTGLTRYAGTRQIFTTKITVPLTGAQDPNNPQVPLTYSGVDPRVPVTGRDVFVLIDDTRGGGIETYDCNQVGGVPLSLPQIQQMATAFVDKDNIWKDEADQGTVTQEDLIRGATRNGSVGADEAGNDDIAIDAHWGAGLVYDYWKVVHNRLSYDNKNSAIKSYIHYGPAYDNAFWNGSSMTYGDGSGTSANNGFRPLVSLDVCGHEIGHGVCSFTSDLVYESESGAMNEGLSDIWAAAIEVFAINKVDATLPYKPFQIGEQISADNIGLRRMDNPKAKTDPDTYGGRYWANPDCVPNLANDQCGVHTNSGVLNKWFYLMVQGPNSTTGSPAYTDDGLADKPRTTPAGTNFVENAGNNYGALPGFLGIGFAKAEQITYLMELSLTPNAKFADARSASIAAAQVLYGPCSQEEISVTDAWFGVNVGAAWAGCTAPTLTVNILDTVITEGSGGCNTFTEIALGVNLIFPQSTATTVNFTVGAGTAEPHDYELSTNSINFDAGQTGNRTIRLRIYNDDLVEGDETINLSATSSFAGFSFNKTITILDDDVNPRLGNTFTLLNETFEGLTDAFPAGWDTVNRTNPTGGLWNVRPPQPSPVTWTTNRAYIYAPTLPVGKGSAVYDPSIGTSVILRTRLIDARGLDSIRLSFVFSAGGETACSPACDYGEVVYSIDGVNFNRFDVDTSSNTQPGNPRTASESLYLTVGDSTYNQVLPRVVSNRQFYLGFRWVNDELATVSPGSITIDNVVVTGQGRKIESDSLSAATTRIPVEPGVPAFFYSEDDRGLLSSIINANADMGCVKDTLVRTGAGSTAYPGPGGRRSNKVHQITASQNANGSYTLTLYYTTQEVAGFAASPSQLQILKTNAATIDQATGANSVVASPQFIDSSAQGFYGYRATFTGLSLFALVEPALAPLPVTCLDFKATKATDNVGLTWKVANDKPGSSFEIERSADGNNFQRIGTVQAATGGQYAFSDRSISGLRAAYYRIREVEANGSSHYLCTVLYVTFEGRNVYSVGNIYPNPGKGDATVSISLSNARKLRIEYVNAAGQITHMQNEQLPSGASLVALKVRSLAAGTYLLRFKDEEGRIISTQQFVKQ